MDIPSLPTDNLYKFMALAGLTAGIIIICLLLQRLVILKEQEAQYQVRFNTVSLEHTILAERTDELTKALNTTEEKVNKEKAKKEHTSDNYLELQRDLESNRQAFAELKKLQTEQRIKEQEVQNAGYLIKQSIEMSAWLSQRGFVVSLICCGYSALGFFGWYINVQRYQDRILQREAEDRAPRKKR